MVKIKETDIIEAAGKGSEAFVNLFATRILADAGGRLTAETMAQLTADQITLLAFQIVKGEVMEGGFIQLIHNGYGPFIFLNPFAKAMRMWGAKPLSNLINDGRALYHKHGEELTRECTDEEFMALYEQHERFDKLDDKFIDMEEEMTDIVAHYIDEHLDHFAEIEK